MEILKSLPRGKILPPLTLSIFLIYVLGFLLSEGRIGPAVAAFSTLPVLLIGWTFGLRAGLAAGVLSLPLNTLLFNLVGISGWGVVFRVGGGPGSLMLIFLGSAVGWARELADQLAHQFAVFQSTQEKLRNSEENYQNVFEGVPIGIYRTTPDGKILTVNSALVDLLGYTDKEAFLAKNVLETFQNPTDRKRWQEIMETDRVIRHFEVQLRREDGSVFWAEDNARMVEDQNGRCLYYEGSLIDITKRKKAEGLLIESETKYRDLLNHIPQKVFYKNTDLVYIKVNPSYANDLQLTPEELVGKTDFDLFPPELAEKYRQDDQQVVRTGTPKEIDEAYFQNGDRRTIHTVKVPVRDSRGTITGVLGIFEDITERTRAEALQEELLAENRRQKDLLERIIQETPAGIAILDGADFRYSLANPGYLEFVHGKGEILGRTVAEVWPEAVDALSPLLDRVYRTGEPFHAVDMPFIMIRDRGPQTAYFTFTYTPLFSAPGAVESLLVTAQETTAQIQARQKLEQELSERKRVEAELRESQQRFQGLFEDSPVSLWEEDFSEVKADLDALKRDEIMDLAKYLDEHPDYVKNCFSQIRVLEVNQETLNLFRAKSKADLLANIDKILAPQNLTSMRDELLAIAQGQRVFESEGRNCTLSDEEIDIHLRWSTAPGMDDRMSRVLVSVLDISSQKRAEERLKKQTAQAEALAGIANALSAASLDAGSIYAIITAQVASLIGDACLLTLISADHAWVEVAAFHHANPERIPVMLEIIPTGSIPFEEGTISRLLRNGKPLVFPTLRKDGLDPVQEPGYQSYLEYFEVDSLMIYPLVAQGLLIGTLGVLRDHPGAAYTVEDLSLLRYLANQAALPILNARLHEQIRQQAHTDPLTGVPNRRYFFDLAELEYRLAERYGHNLAVIMLDIDGFKAINDAYGHDFGDQVLQRAALQCRVTLRRADLIGRFGGDEFLVLLPETALVEACQIAERLREAIEVSSPVLGEMRVPITASLGVAQKTDSTADLPQLLKMADEAMYLAKREGRNRVRTCGPDPVA